MIIKTKYICNICKREYYEKEKCRECIDRCTSLEELLETDRKYFKSLQVGVGGSGYILREAYYILHSSNIDYFKKIVATIDTGLTIEYNNEHKNKISENDVCVLEINEEYDSEHGVLQYPKIYTLKEWSDRVRRLLL